LFPEGYGTEKQHERQKKYPRGKIKE